MYTKEEYITKYKEYLNILKIKKLVEYIEECLNHNSSLGCPVARFEGFQLSPADWKIVNTNEAFKNICSNYGYEVTFDKDEDGRCWMTITSKKSVEDAKIWNEVFSNNGVDFFFAIIISRIFDSDFRFLPRYTIHKNGCSEIVWKFANNKEFLQKIKEHGWDFDIGIDRYPYIEIH
jgi:hypothetical protein